jgi:antiviral defense system Shedu protein SduA
VNILFTAVGDFLTVEARACLNEWRATYHAVEQMPMDRVTSYLRFGRASELALVDAIVCMADMDGEYAARTVRFDFSGDWLLGGGPFRRLDSPLEKALALADEVSKLPEACTMRDGRKWKSIPLVIFSDRADSASSAARRRSNVSILPTNDPTRAMSAIARVVDKYQDRVLADYEALGMLVRFVKGRAQIGPALRLKPECAESEYYYAPGDRRTHTSWVTVKRDSEGLRADVELFQLLLERKASETEMHQFFAEHPAILMQARMGIPISHGPRFSNPKDNTPDFAFSPILGPWNAKAVELMELKGPAERALRKGPHPGFSAKVMRAVDQVRDYGRYLGYPANLQAVLEALGYVPDEPKLAVLIGREPKTSEEREVRAQRQTELNVKVVTYDEILATQEKQLKRREPYVLQYGTAAFPLG